MVTRGFGCPSHNEVELINQKSVQAVVAKGADVLSRKEALKDVSNNLVDNRSYKSQKVGYLE